MFENEKNIFLNHLKEFAKRLYGNIDADGKWTVKGFIDICQNVYTISSDTKVISKILELQLFPHLQQFAEQTGYIIELPKYQNWYPNFTFISKYDERIKFAVDLKTTYIDEQNPQFCNGFTLGSHGEYFIDRKSTKNVQYPYSEYSGHFCFGVIYSRAKIIDEIKTYSVSQLAVIPSVIENFTFFAEEKWKIASDKSGSGNTANIGSIRYIDDILNGNGVFINAGEQIFDEYWANFGKIKIRKSDGTYKNMSSLEEYLQYRGLPSSWNHPQKSKRK